MMKITVSILLLKLFCMYIMAQGGYKLDTIMRTGDTLISFNSINNIDIKSVEIKKKAYKIYINSILIDSIEARVLDLPMYFDNHIFINALFQPGINPEKKIRISNNGELIHYSDVFNYDDGIKQVYKIGKDLLKIHLYNPITKAERLFCDFSDIVLRDLTDEEHTPLEEIVDVFFINTKTAYVKICYFGPFAGCWKSRYFIVNEKGEKKEITIKIEPKSKEKIENYSSKISFTSNGFIRESLDLQVIENKTYKQVYKNRLFDDNFNLMGEVLYFEPKIKGVNVLNDKVQYYYLESRIQNNINVFIPYKFIPELDIAMYKAYNNANLTQEDLKGFNKYELGILRNLIFAKHNYDFSSEFYQAYFNLYAFYNAPDMRNSRTKDVNGKLTVTDKQNLELIKSLEN